MIIYGLMSVSSIRHQRNHKQLVAVMIMYVVMTWKRNKPLKFDRNGSWCWAESM